MYILHEIPKIFIFIFDVLQKLKIAMRFKKIQIQPQIDCLEVEG